MYCSRRKRLQLSRILFLLSGVFLCTLYQLTISARLAEPWPMPQIGVEGFGEGSTEGLEEATVEPLGLVEPSMEASDLEQTDQTTPAAQTGHHSPTRLDHISSPTKENPQPPAKNQTVILHCIYVAPQPPILPPPLPPPEVHVSKGDYPTDLFSVEERRRGWVILHIIGMVYMFVSLAIVCDEFFVPALGVITDKLAISDDVAGATFMAAGGSAPELCTSLIGVFVSHSNVGIGTIVGSAVFNILFVIGMCAVFSREILHLTWWPLFRDVSFYILNLILLINFFLDNVITYRESMMLLGGYASYVCFMKYNVQIERAFKSLLNKQGNIIRVISVEDPNKGGGAKRNVADPEDNNLLKQLKPDLQRGGSSTSLHNSTMRDTIFKLMTHTLDPLGSSGGKGETTKEPEAPPAKNTGQKHKPEGKKVECKKADSMIPVSEDESRSGGSEDDDDSTYDEDSGEGSKESTVGENDGHTEQEEEEEEDKPLSLEWPETQKKQITYLFLLPIVFPLWLTVPDVRNPTSKKFYVITFLASIGWIGVFSYLMVWWAHQVGETIGISEEIMGLTILAAGTSIPDLITSVIVARKGLGDMAVSSSVGSNIFDITVGLPVPWLIYSSLHNFDAVEVSSNGLFCAIVLLFLMLLFVIISIASCGWKMNKALGSTMFMLYIVFLVLSVMLEDRILTCPVSI